MQVIFLGFVFNDVANFLQHLLRRHEFAFPQNLPNKIQIFKNHRQHKYLLLYLFILGVGGKYLGGGQKFFKLHPGKHPLICCNLRLKGKKEFCQKETELVCLEQGVQRLKFICFRDETTIIRCSSSHYLWLNQP